MLPYCLIIPHLDINTGVVTPPFFLVAHPHSLYPLLPLPQTSRPLLHHALTINPNQQYPQCLSCTCHPLSSSHNQLGQGNERPKKLMLEVTKQTPKNVQRWLLSLEICKILVSQNLIWFIKLWPGILPAHWSSAYFGIIAHALLIQLE